MSEIEHDGCDCTELCSMGPTCPGGALAGLPGSGCWRTKVEPVRVSASSLPPPPRVPVVGEQWERLGEAVKDTCWRAQPYGEDAEGYVSHYLLTAGTMHRLIAAAQGAGVAAAFPAPAPDNAEQAAEGGEA